MMMGVPENPPGKSRPQMQKSGQLVVKDVDKW
jgi:hypothetical protein